MVFFSRVKIPVGTDFCDNRIRPDTRFVYLLFKRFCQLFLYLIMVKYNRAVLCSHIGSLTVQCGGVVCLPENFQQLLKTNFRWIINYLYHFGIPCISLTHLLISRIGDFATRIAGFRRNHSFYPLKDSLATPETARTQCGSIEFHFNFLS